jgi:hypothetical protein
MELGSDKCDGVIGRTEVEIKRWRRCRRPQQLKTSGSGETVSVVVKLLSAGFGSGTPLETVAVSVTSPAVAGNGKSE